MDDDLYFEIFQKQNAKKKKNFKLISSPLQKTLKMLEDRFKKQTTLQGHFETVIQQYIN